MKFETTQTATQTEWSTWTITLQPVVGGNAPTSEVDPDDFPVSKLSAEHARPAWRSGLPGGC
jgi:hypothetical protein